MWSKLGRKSVEENGKNRCGGKWEEKVWRKMGRTRVEETGRTGVEETVKNR